MLDLSIFPRARVWVIAGVVVCGVALPWKMARAQPAPTATSLPAGTAPGVEGAHLDLIGPDGRPVKSSDAEAAVAPRKFNAFDSATSSPQMLLSPLGPAGLALPGGDTLLPGVSIAGSLTESLAGSWNPDVFRTENAGEIAYQYNLKETKPGVIASVPVTGSALLGILVLGGLAFLASRREKKRRRRRSRSRRR